MFSELENLHPRVTAWLHAHKREQEKRARELKAHKDSFGWNPGPLRDLTMRDLHRFQASSLIFSAVEKAGVAILASPINGKVSFLVGDEKIECSIVEKLFKPVKADNTWTAYPDHHQTGLQSSGFLRVTITTYFREKRPEWIETKEIKIADYIDDIVAAVVRAGNGLAQWHKELMDAEEARRVDGQRRYEEQKARELDDRRWARLCEMAENWDLRTKLASFVAEIELRVAAEGDFEVAGRSAHDWLGWALERIERLDPFARGAKGTFEAVVHSAF